MNKFEHLKSSRIHKLSKEMIDTLNLSILLEQTVQKGRKSFNRYQRKSWAGFFFV